MAGALEGGRLDALLPRAQPPPAPMEVEESVSTGREVTEVTKRFSGGEKENHIG